MKKQLLIIGIIILILTVGLSGCNEIFDNSSGADVKITSLYIDKTHPEGETYPSFRFTVELKNVGNSGDKTTVKAKLYAWYDYWYSLGSDWEKIGYIDSGDTAVSILAVVDKNKQADKYKVEITADTEEGKNQWYDLELGGGYYTDVFTEEFYIDDLPQ